MADMHTVQFAIVIEDYDKWSEDECPDTRDHWDVLNEITEVMKVAAREYMSNHPSQFPMFDLL